MLEDGPVEGLEDRGGEEDGDVGCERVVAVQVHGVALGEGERVGERVGGGGGAEVDGRAVWVLVLLGAVWEGGEGEEGGWVEEELAVVGLGG